MVKPMNELKPEDVMRALEHCAKHHINECKKCPYRNHNHCFGTLLADALALLREKDAEIERLRNALAISKKETKRYMTLHKQTRAEAIDEFADALEKHFCHDPAFLGVEQRIIMDVVKQKAKELKGGTPNA